MLKKNFWNTLIHSLVIILLEMKSLFVVKFEASPATDSV